MKIQNKLFFILFCVLFYFVDISAQQSPKEKFPLRDVLELIQKEYKVRFSYADYIIEDKFTSKPNQTIPLQELLYHLEKETNLEFQLIDEAVIVIRLKKQPKTKGHKRSLEFEPLEEVLVQGYLTSGISKNNDGSIDLKTDKLGILPGLIEPDVLQIINSFPGVMTVDESVSNLNVRGGTHDQNLILFDGIRMYKSGHFFGLISAFNPYLDYDINLSKSGSSAKYGESISSVIDMKLPNQISGQYKTAAGANLISVDALSHMPLSSSTELQLAARRSITDFVKTPTYNQYFKRAFQDSKLSALLNNNSVLVKDETFSFHDIYGKFIWDISPNDKLQFLFLTIENELSYNQRLTGSISDFDQNSKLNQQSYTTGITYTKKWNFDFNTRIQKYFTHYELASNSADVLNNQNLIQENVVQENGLKIDSEYNFSPSSSLHSGYQFSQVAISNLEDVDNPEFRSYIKEVLLTHSVYGQFNYNSDRVQLKSGVRLNYFQKFNRYLIEPRLTFNYKFLNHFSFLATAEIKSQAVSQIIDLQEDFLGIEKRRWIVANERETPIITSKQASSGIYFKKNNLLISGEFYVKEVQNISARSQGFQNQFQFVNDIGNYSVHGFDFLITKRFKNFNTWLGYSYNKNTYQFASLNNAESFPNNIDVRSVINVAANYTHNDIKVALGLNWHTGKPFTKPLQSDNSIVRTINFDNPNSSRLEDYLRLDASVQYKFNIRKARATTGISVWSILDKRNILNTYYNLENNQIHQVENTSLRITPNLSFRVEF